ncbi:unnamed protein product [Cylindrotheca closterium]|uniref:Actin-related protein 8 n=1 Tax=Cylindrotheca closterium TaxID=2856 RepID=A0AAD2G0X7_9STRA|nr:unnamed protein product [Cylindrotheca closterium]
MYCGDETGSFIGEIGSHTCRFGYGGEDNPKYVAPSYVSDKKRMASSCLTARAASQDLESILRMPESLGNEPLLDPDAFLRQGDSVQDWDNLQVAWNEGMDTLRAKDTQKHTKGGTPYSTTVKKHKTIEGKCIHPILAIMPGFTHFEGYGPKYSASMKREQYAKYMEIVMEHLEATSLFLAPSPMLAAFSVGRQNALVVDVGAGGCRVTPVIDGHILQHSQRRNGRGGDWMGHVAWKAMLEQELPVIPRYKLRQKGCIAKSPSFHNWAVQDLMYELRTDPNVSVAPMDEAPSRTLFTNYDAAEAPTSPASGEEATPSTFELPDGTPIDLSTPFGKDVTRIPELLFSETMPFSSQSSSSSSSSELQTLSNAPLHHLIRESLLAVGDVDARKDLVGSICLSGASSVFPNMESRLSAELSALLPGFVKPKVVASRNSVERRYAPWIGASILTSLGSFQQLWMSRSEYFEYGAAMGVQRFP